MLTFMNPDIAKRAAGQKASTFVEDGMIIGLGTGTTSFYFIEALIQKCKQGMRIKTAASSDRSAKLAREGGLPVFDINDLSHIDLTVDGADEIDPKKRMIKGGGGAHVRERILAASSAEMIVIVDESKLVSSIGHTKLPVEILPYGSIFTAKKIEHLGFSGKWRCCDNSTLNQELFVTENGNFLFDIYFQSPPANPEKMHEDILQIPGVVDTGFFFNMASRVIVGKSDGTTIMKV